MKKFFITIAAMMLGLSAFAQATKAKLPDLQFETVKANPITPVKNQASSGTCWCFSGIGFFESEAIRINNIKNESEYPDFSEFYIVSNSYMERAVKYVRLDGKLGFSAGSSSGDVRETIRDWGLVPNADMTGMQYGTPLPKQAELDAVLKGYVDAVARIPNKTLSTAWKKGFQGILDAYLGPKPKTFTVAGKTYTPQEYRDALKLDMNNYVDLTSFTHHPFYTMFEIEVCDNWRHEQSYNVPIDELMAALDNAIMNGYTVVWGADVSDPGFSRDGVAMFVDVDASAKAGSDQEHWLGKEEGKPAPVVVVEKQPTQESRQIDFDNKTMTDDHGMQIYGIAKDQNGNKFYMVKNSWGDTGKYHGLWYASEAYVKGQTLDLMFNKESLPKDLRKKLGI